jgi:hypothetical protein
MKVAAQILAVGQDSAFLHLVQTLLDDVGLRVHTTMEWQKVPDLAATMLPAITILDLTPATETVCLLAVEALRAQAVTKNMTILMCPVAPWLVEEHTHQIDRHGTSIWSDGYDLQELLRFVTTAVDGHNSLSAV